MKDWLDITKYERSIVQVLLQKGCKQSNEV